ncbi:hypothetical protein BCT86_11790 [Vibrio breoganii]|uniref:Sel1 repeat family protein n=1 Tax=Vibrio breoganii TaxID=553239 RepID=A0AAN1CT32_9VIBR|nr:sel1 repeat family protein [Vibrio breoganii]ANO34175.1 hypothetical protein A6E01_13255 [Vibrio breoganii]PMG77809.1 hypothetical protein BCU83_15030 [Vibrio breoganii]PMK41395.1 hypothetical protein BCU00_14255 [Vibrio breoganii]PML06578.1 hypothetical protein BCT86_11790 [Vibrio breoganii]PML38875.1 hypothetical protein BCT77_12815 [Vibrio breoganii]
MDTVTEMIATVGSILAFMIVFLGVAKWFSSRTERAERRRQAAEQQAHLAEAERVRIHKEKVALADNGHLAKQLELAKENEHVHPKEAVYWYEKAALQDSRDGIEGFVRVCEASADDVVPQDKYRYWRNALDALNGDEQAEYEQGIALFEGFGIRSNMDKGIQLIEHAANRRCVRAQMFLADWYKSPENPLADAEKAKMWRSMSEHVDFNEHSK